MWCPLETVETLRADEVDVGSRLDLFVAAKMDISRTRSATLIANGDVIVNGDKEKAAYKIEPDDVIDVRIPQPQIREVKGEDIPLDIVYEDPHLLVIDKEAGMVVHPAPGNWSGTLVNALLGRNMDLPYSSTGGLQRAGLVHRLDKETSGLLVIAKTEKVHATLSKALANRLVMRRYATMIWGHLKEETITIDKPIGRDPRDRKKMAIVESGKTAKTDFRRLGRFGAGDLLRAHLHTGRTHQIRIHLASIGHPVIGDDTYGGGGGRRLSQIPPRRHFLHAARLAFKHPATGEDMDFRSPLPEDLKKSLAAIGESEEYMQDPDPLQTFGFFDE